MAIRTLNTDRSAVALGLALALGSMATASAAWQSPPTNAADNYRAAFALWDALPSDLQQRLADAAGDPEILAGSMPNLADDLAQAGPTIDAFLAAAAVENCDWGLDRSEGFALLLPHLAPMRNLARVASLEATVALSQGNADRAANALEAISRGTRHLSADPVLIDSLVAGSLLSTVARTAATASDAGLVDAELASRLLEILPEQAAPALGIERAMRSEVDAVAAEFDRIADGGGTFDPSIAELFGAGGDGESGGADRDRTLVLFEEIAGEATVAMLEPDPNRRLEMIDAIDARIAELPEDDPATRLVRMLTPSYRNVARSLGRLDAEFAEVRQTLVAIAAGESNLAGANAAYWYLRSVARLQAIPSRAQIALELERQAPEAVDPAMAEEIADWLERLETAGVLDTLREAASIEACDFTLGQDSRRTPGRVLLHEAFPTIRAGSRLLLISAARDLRRATSLSMNPQAGDPIDGATALALRTRGVSDLVATISIARHLALDGTPGGTMTAASICCEAGDLLERLPIDLDDAEFESLERAIARLPRTAPHGMLGADAAQASVTVKALELVRDTGEDDRRPASPAAALRGLAAVAEVPAAFVVASDAPLRAADDLIAIERWVEWKALADRLRAVPIQGERLLERLVILGEIPAEATEWGTRALFTPDPVEAAVDATGRLDQWISDVQRSADRSAPAN